ncbi:MAG: T9SS type A sorting domain-containing protein, partial [Bacteroidales bacterium]|nr:T9SS type A sorting domain-containing protein [Bacteroidales bacterium]
KSDNEILSTSIFNFTGQLVKQQVINGDNTQINVRDLQTGIYFIMLTTNKGEQISKKIVVK